MFRFLLFLALIALGWAYSQGGSGMAAVSANRGRERVETFQTRLQHEQRQLEALGELLRQMQAGTIRIRTEMQARAASRDPRVCRRPTPQNIADFECSAASNEATVVAELARQRQAVADLTHQLAEARAAAAGR